MTQVFLSQAKMFREINQKKFCMGALSSSAVRCGGVPMKKIATRSVLLLIGWNGISTVDGEAPTDLFAVF